AAERRAEEGARRHPGERRRHGATELAIVRHVELRELRQHQVTGERAIEAVAVEVQRGQAREPAELRRDAAVEAVPGEVHLLEQRQREEPLRQPAGEPVPGEVQRPELDAAADVRGDPAGYRVRPERQRPQRGEVADRAHGHRSSQALPGEPEL
ncbi:Os06g0172675, partial [Oryza sativa Japonica Group]